MSMVRNEGGDVYARRQARASRHSNIFLYIYIYSVLTKSIFDILIQFQKLEKIDPRTLTISRYERFFSEGQNMNKFVMTNLSDTIMSRWVLDC